MGNGIYRKAGSSGFRGGLMGTVDIITIAVIAALIVFAVIKIIRSKNHMSCGGDCSRCSSACSKKQTVGDK